VNVGDYLIGMGYRLVSREAGSLGADVVSDILDCLAQAHLKLAEGQGAELLWRDSHDKQLKPIDALKIYALKTAPAFEAALFAGVRMAGPADRYVQPIKQFARHLGVAFQILNDLKDWEGDTDNKLSTGTDVLRGRPTVLWALALEHLSDRQCQELMSLVQDDELPPEVRLRRVRQLYADADVFDKAHRLVDKHQQRAEAIAEELQPDELQRLLYFLIDTVLERTSDPLFGGQRPTWAL
jgi:geranylgeranyl pyrophosphate synthase